MSFSEWREVKVSEIGKIVTGKTPKTAISENYGGNIPFLTPSDDMNIKKVKSTARTLSEMGLNSVKNCLLPAKSICVSCIGSDLGKVVLTSEPTVTNQQINSIVPDEKFDPDFIYYGMTILGKHLNYLSKTSTAVPIINKTTFSNFSIIVPSIEEQKAIAHILSTLDDKIEVNNKINKTLENMAQEIFKQWFVDFEFPNEDGEPYKSSGGEMIESELGMIPKGWEVGNLKDKLNFERGIEPGSKNYSKTYFERSIPFYRVGDMLGIAQNYVDKNLINDKTLERRDVAVSFDGTVGRVVTGLRGSYSTGIRKIYAKKGEYFPNCFIYFLFKTEFIQSTIMQYASGTTILHASESIEYLAIPYHEEIIKKFVLIIEAIFNTIVNKKKENESLSNTRDILLPKLMSGEIRVPLNEEGDVS